MDVETYFTRTRKSLIDLLNKEITNRAVRSQATIWIRFVRDEVEQVSLAFNSRMMTVYSLNNKNEIVTAMIEHVAQQIEIPALRNSKFVFDRVLHMDIDFHRLNLMRGSSYVPLPDWLMKKKAIINPKNSNMECFKWAVIAAMKWEEIGNNPERVSKLRRYEGDFDWSDIEFPVSFRDINKFERNNEIGVNILANGFESEIIRDEHYEYCRSKDLVRVEMPTKNPVVKYADGQYQFKVPFVIYADFESILVPVNVAPNNPEMSWNKWSRKHTLTFWMVHVF